MVRVHDLLKFVICNFFGSCFLDLGSCFSYLNSSLTIINNVFQRILVFLAKIKIMKERHYSLPVVLIFFLCVASLEVFAQNKDIQKEKFNWGRGTQDTTAGYAQAVKVGNVIYISGTVARDVTPEGIKRVYDALERTLKSYGATFQNVVKETLFTTDIEAMKQHNAVRKAYYKGDFPAATWVQISRLFMADAKLEVELIAHLPE